MVISILVLSRIFGDLRGSNHFFSNLDSYYSYLHILLEPDIFFGFHQVGHLVWNDPQVLVLPCWGAALISYNQRYYIVSSSASPLDSSGFWRGLCPSTYLKQNKLYFTAFSRDNRFSGETGSAFFCEKPSPDLDGPKKTFVLPRWS